MRKSNKQESLDFLIPGINPHVIANKQGKKLGVFFEIGDYEKLITEMEDALLGVIATKIKQKKVPGTPLAIIERKIKAKRKK
jgi:hypothetical protein